MIKNSKQLLQESERERAENLQNHSYEESAAITEQRLSSKFVQQLYMSIWGQECLSTAPKASGQAGNS